MASGLSVFTGALWCPSVGDVEAIAVRDGRIIAVGDPARALMDTAGEIVVIDEGVLIPAFGDGHAHPLFGGLEAAGPQIRAQDTIDGIVAEVARWAAAHPDELWIRGASYDPSLAPHGLFDARWLDAAVPDRPVALQAADYHTMWVNSRALELAGITVGSPDPPLGQIPRRPDGTALGTLREWGAVDLVGAVAGPRPMEVRVQALERAARMYAALGVTWVQDAWVDLDTVEVYLEAARSGRLPIRFNLALYADPRRWPTQLEDLVEARRRVEQVGNPFLCARTVKFFADGVIESGTAALLDHYCGCPGETGMLVWPPDLLAQAVTAVDAAGFQPHVHVIGDRAARVALDALEAAHRANGPRDRRPVLAHIQLIDATDRPRLAALGAIANAEPLWAQLDDVMTTLTTPRLGPHRCDEQYPWADLVTLGTDLSFGSDWPVSSPNPIEGLAVACSRQSAQRHPPGGWTPDQRLALDVAFRAYTAGTAYQGFRTAGRLAVGHDADLVQLSQDPRRVDDPRALDRLRTRRVWLAGREVACGAPPP